MQKGYHFDAECCNFYTERCNFDAVSDLSKVVGLGGMVVAGGMSPFTIPSVEPTVSNR